MENKKNSSKAKRTLTNFIVTIIFAFIYYYNSLPAFNLHDPGFYTFVFWVAVVYCFMSILTQGIFKAESGKAFWQEVKTRCAAPLYICMLSAIYIVAASSPADFPRRGLTASSAVRMHLRDWTRYPFDQIPMLAGQRPQAPTTRRWASCRHGIPI